VIGAIVAILGYYFWPKESPDWLSVAAAILVGVLGASFSMRGEGFLIIALVALALVWVLVDQVDDSPLDPNPEALGRILALGDSYTSERDRRCSSPEPTWRGSTRYTPREMAFCALESISYAEAVGDLTDADRSLGPTPATTPLTRDIASPQLKSMIRVCAPYTVGRHPDAAAASARKREAWPRENAKRLRPFSLERIDTSPDPAGSLAPRPAMSSTRASRLGRSRIPSRSSPTRR